MSSQQHEQDDLRNQISLLQKPFILFPSDATASRYTPTSRVRRHLGSWGKPTISSHRHLSSGSNALIKLLMLRPLTFPFLTLRLPLWVFVKSWQVHIIPRPLTQA
eukprot:COSAG01_NODE_1172_length_11400_cov_12.759579_7_plen_105_part_00